MCTNCESPRSFRWQYDAKTTKRAIDKNESSWIVRHSGDRHGSMDSPHRKHVCIVHRSARTTRGCAVLPHAARDASVGASAVKCIVNGPHFAQTIIMTKMKKGSTKVQIIRRKSSLIAWQAAASWNCEDKKKTRSLDAKPALHAHSPISGISFRIEASDMVWQRTAWQSSVRNSRDNDSHQPEPAAWESRPSPSLFALLLLGALLWFFAPGNLNEIASGSVETFFVLSRCFVFCLLSPRQLQIHYANETRLLFVISHKKWL